MQFETRCVHTGVDKDSAFLSATTPIYPTSTFRWDNLNTNRGFDYTRSGNPTRRALEENLTALEGGIDCRATCTGMAAITATMHLFQPGNHIIQPLVDTKNCIAKLLGGAGIMIVMTYIHVLPEMMLDRVD